MKPNPFVQVLCGLTATLALTASVVAGQAPGSDAMPDVAISHRDRVYAAEQFSNTVSVSDPVDNKLLGVIRLGDSLPANFSPLYRGQLLVHGMGFSPDHKTLAVVAIGSNSVSFIDTATNAVKHVSYVGRSPHEAFFTPDNKEVWITVRGENYVLVLDAKTFEEKKRIVTNNGPGMTIFSPDNKYGYVCSSFTPEVDVITVKDHKVVARVPQPSPFCPNIAATPDGKQVWITLKDTGKTMVFDARPPFTVLKIMETGPISNHVNFARTAAGQFAYVTIGGLNQVKVFRTDSFDLIATIDVGDLPHGIWPSGDGSRMYVGLENADALTAIDTTSNTVVGNIPIGQSPQAIAYVSNAVPEGDGLSNLEPIGLAGMAVHLELAAPGSTGKVPTTVALLDQGLVQVLEAAVTGLKPGQAYVLALADNSAGTGALQPLANFKTNPAGAAIVNAIGPIRQLVQGLPANPGAATSARYLVISPLGGDQNSPPVQVQVASRP